MQPIRVVPQPVLLVPPPRNDFSGALISDNKREDGETKDNDDEKEHDDEVEPEEEGDAAPSADEASEGDNKEENSKKYNRLFKELLAVSGGAAGEPDAAGNDGDGEKQRDEIETSNDIVAHSNHLLSLSLARLRVFVFVSGDEDEVSGMAAMDADEKLGIYRL